MNLSRRRAAHPAPRPSRTSAAALAVGSLVLLAGCGVVAAGEDDRSPSTSDAGGPVSAVDGSGAEIRLDAPAERVVCLDGSCLDALAELDLAPVASTQLDAVRHPAFFGPDADVEPVGGTFFEPELETVLAAQPDLVIGAASTHAELAEALGEVPLYLSSGQSEEDAVDHLEAVAALTGRETQAEEALDRFEATLAAYEPGARETSVLSMYGGATDDLGIDALDSQIGQTLSAYTDYPWPAAGEADGGFLETDVETVAAQDPDWIWVLDFGFDPDAEPLLDQLAAQPIWEDLTAVRAGQVRPVEAWWGTTYGTRSRQLLLDEVLPTVYPEEFPEPLGPLADVTR